MKVKAVKQGEDDDSDVTMLIIYAESKRDIECLAEIIPSTIQTIRNYMESDNDQTTDS